MEQYFEPVESDVDSAFLVMDGSAYYDIEMDDSGWIRVNVERGDLIIIPRGHNYRFTLTPQVLLSILKDQKQTFFNW